MKTAISIPDALFERVEREAARLGLSRSAFFAKALADFLDREGPSRVTESLDRVYAAEPAVVDPGLAALQRASWPREAW
ncbi:MAG: ribbon-helix-helix protein, CopG family [Planctomycetota bacterium]